MTNGRTDGRTDGRTGGWGIWLDGLMDGCHLDERMDRWAEGWMDGWMKTGFNRMAEYLRACSTFTEDRLTWTQPHDRLFEIGYFSSSIFDIFASRLPFLLLKWNSPFQFIVSFF